MFDYNRGAKAGGVAGLIIGAINAIIGAIILSSFADTLQISSTGIEGILFTTIFISMIISGIIGGVLSGGIFGIIFAAVIDKLPGSTTVIKGLIFAIIYWIVVAAGLGYYTSSGYGMTYYLTYNLALGFVLYMLWGFLTGKLWDRYGGGKEQPLI